MYFAVFNRKDECLFGITTERDCDVLLQQVVLFGALDMVELAEKETQSLYLGNVDVFQEWQVSAFVSHCDVVFLLLHKSVASERMKAFFHKTHKMYVELLMNPFYEVDGEIRFPWFRQKLKNMLSLLC
ncbi:MAG: TRAPP complex subunit Trs20 [Amphiamblys sp. WSBS2006]|nr:MAG: TRAPP complex subunit Trs20 [Amphiamblys sp. WSBS2006]